MWGAYTVQISELDEYVMLDSELQDAYKDTLNKNSTISAAAFPVLEPGENTISWDGGRDGRRDHAPMVDNIDEIIERCYTHLHLQLVLSQ